MLTAPSLMEAMMPRDAGLSRDHLATFNMSQLLLLIPQACGQKGINGYELILWAVILINWLLFMPLMVLHFLRIYTSCRCAGKILNLGGARDASVHWELRTAPRMAEISRRQKLKKVHVSAPPGHCTDTTTLTTRREGEVTSASPARPIINHPKLDFFGPDSLIMFDWVEVVWSDGESITLLVDGTAITEHRAKAEVVQQFGLPEKNVKVATFTSSYFRYLNGDSNTLSIRQLLYFRTVIDGETCVKTCTIGGFETLQGKQYLLSSGHNSAKGFDYYSDPGLTKYVGRCEYLNVGETSDLAAIEVKSKRIKQFHKNLTFRDNCNNTSREVKHGLVTMVTGCALEVMNSIRGKDKRGRVVIHTGGKPLHGVLNVLWTKKEKKASLGIELHSSGGATCQPGDSGSLVTSRPLQKNGNAVADAAALVSGLGTFRSSSGTSELVIAFPLAASVEDFHTKMRAP